MPKLRTGIPLFATPRCERGMTLVEIIIAMALMMLIIAAAAVSIKAMSKSSDTAKLTNDLNRILYGINEYQLIAKNIPTGDSWPAVLNDFVEPTLRGSYSYACNGSTGNAVTITTLSTFNFDPTQKLKDQALCTDDSYTAYNQDKTVTCRPVIFSTQACS